jgi:dihydrofolate reductase
LSEFITLDGFIAGPSGHIDWGDEYNDQEMLTHLIETQRNWDTLLIGRLTYEELASSWASVNAEGNPIAEFMNKVPKVVFSKTLTEATWGKWKTARVVAEGIVEEIQKLKRQPGKDMAILGSANLVRQFAKQDLIDEYSLMMYPVAIGRGKPLFTGLDERLRLKLLGTRPFHSGVLELRYQPTK